MLWEKYSYYLCFIDKEIEGLWGIKKLAQDTTGGIIRCGSWFQIPVAYALNHYVLMVAQYLWRGKNEIKGQVIR